MLKYVEMGKKSAGMTKEKTLVLKTGPSVTSTSKDSNEARR